MADTSDKLVASQDKENASMSLSSFKDDGDLNLETTTYRWVMFGSFGLTILCVGTMSSYYNFLPVFLVDVLLPSP